MRRHRVDLAERIDLLTRAVDLSEGYIPDDVVALARAVVERATGAAESVATIPSLRLLVRRGQGNLRRSTPWQVQNWPILG